MTRFIEQVLRYRGWILAGMALVTLAAGAMITRGVIASSMARLVLGEHPAFHRYLEHNETFGGDDVIVVSYRPVEGEPLLSKPDQRRLKKVKRALSRLLEVRRLRSLLDVQRVRGDGDQLDVTAYAHEARRHPERRAELLGLLGDDPFAGGILLSRDGRRAAVVIELRLDVERNAERTHELVAEVKAAFTDEGYPASDVLAVGLPAGVGATIVETHHNVKRLFPAVFVTLLLVVWVLFRRLWPAAVAMAVALIAVIWTMGFSILLDRQVSVLSSIVPGIILIISTSDVVHLLSAYLLELGDGLPRREAIVAAAADVGRACVLTSVTTLAGFVALSFVPTPIFRQFGIVLGFGTAMALLIAVTLVPILLSLFPAPRPWTRTSQGRVQAALDRALVGTARLSERWPRAVVAGFVLLAVASVVFAARVHFEIDFARRLSSDHPFRLASEEFQRRYAGSSQVQVVITRTGGEEDQTRARAEDGGRAEGEALAEAQRRRGGAEGGGGQVHEREAAAVDLLDPKIMASLARWQHAVEARPEIGGALSLVDLFERIHEAMGGDGGLPTTREGLAQHLLLFEMGGAAELERLVDFGRRAMLVTFYLPLDGARRAYEAGLAAAALAAEHVDPRVSVEVTGLSYLTGQWLDEVIAGQRRGLTFAFVAITLIMMIGLRSWRVGLWSMFPNSLPLLALAGVLGLTWGQVDSDTLAVMMVAIGIGVDDTIHFLSRYRLERRRQADVGEALRMTFRFSGRGIVITSIILVLGFSPFALSDYMSVWIMGTLQPMTLLVALVADLLLVPALIRLGLIRFEARDAT